MPAKRKPGRPPSGEPRRSERIASSYTPDEHAAIEAARREWSERIGYEIPLTEFQRKTTLTALGLAASK